MSDLNAYIISVQAANKGVFVHPPEGRKTPLTDMEYGYQFAPAAWRELLSKKLHTSTISRITADVVSIYRDGDTIRSVTLSNGDVTEADFFIDCLGPTSKLKSTKTQLTTKRRLKAVTNHKPAATIGPVRRTLRGTSYGWTSNTPLQDGLHRLTVFDPKSEAAALADHGPSDTPPVEMQIGYAKIPWAGNCLTLGLGAASLEPLTPAPITGLQRDIDRLIELIPVTDKMTVESREYNRRLSDDYRHASMFHRALFPATMSAETPYQTAVTSNFMSKELVNKIEQFEARGVLVQYDCEPFSAEDWAMLHIGMGRQPKRYDPLADRVSDEQLKNKLTQMSGAIDSVTAKMPPHHVYMSGLLRYLKEQHG